MKGRRPKKQKTPISTTAIGPEPPAWMGEHAAEVWRRTIADLETEGRPIHQLNLQLFTGFCEAAGLVRECAEILSRDGMLIDGGRDGQRRHPAVSMRLSALTALRGYAVELGLAPGAVGRLAAPSAAAKAEPWLMELRRNPTRAYLDHIAEHGCEPDNEFFEF